jgi:hypothetical protein
MFCAPISRVQVSWVIPAHPIVLLRYILRINALSLFVYFVSFGDINIIIIIICHQLDSDRPVSASSVSLFKGLPSCRRPFGL